MTGIDDVDNLPDGWAATVLDNVGDWATGGTPSRKVSSYFGGHIPWVKSGDLKDGPVFVTEETLTRAGIENSSAKVLPKGTVSVALYGATIGKLGILEIEAATNQACANCRVNTSLADRQFIFYYLFQQRQPLIEAGQGGAQPNLTNGIVRDWPIPLPPLAEQRRIVAKVEELLARVNAARARLAKVPALVKRFRQSVLAAACSGDLSADWREMHPRITPARALLMQIQRGRNTMEAAGPPEEIGSEFPEKWAPTTLGFLAEPTARGKPFVTSGSRGWAEYVSPKGPYFIRSENINTEYLRLADAIRVNPPAGAEADRTVVQAGDLLLTITGNNVGRTATVPVDCPRAHVSQHVAIIRLSPHCRAQFVWLWLRSIEHGQKQLQSYFYGYTKPGLNLEQVKSVAVMLPPIEEQAEIVRRVDAFFALADKIKARAKSAAARVEKITQAILAKAFLGELVPTEAELARAEGRSYEPASALLDRIRAEWEAAGAKAKGATKRPMSRKGKSN